MSKEIRAINAYDLLNRAGALGPVMPKDRYAVLRYTIKAFVAESPTIDPEELRPTGHWVKCMIGHKCSECNSRSFRKRKFCPECGARNVKIYGGFVEMKLEDISEAPKEVEDAVR